MGRHGFIDHSGQFAIKPQFDDAGSFSEGLAWIEKRGRYGYINKLGQIVIKPQFETPNDFSAGLSRPESWFH
jgi:hypothetical protein